MNDSHLIATRLACWTSNPAMQDHFLLPLLKDAKAHIEAQDKRVAEMQAEMTKMAEQLGTLMGKQILKAMYEGEG